MEFSKLNLRMERKAMALWANAVLVVMISSNQQSVSCVPVSVSSGNENFYNKLYKNASEQSCVLLPRVSEAHNNYTSSKINQLCGSNIVAEENVSPSRKELSHISICNSLLTIFPLICKSNARNVTANVTVDLMGIGSLGIEKVCTNLENVMINISKHGDDIVSPFSSKSGISNGKSEDSSCLTLCKNSRESREGFNEDSELVVHPACILLYKSYTVYQEVSMRNQSTLNSSTAKSIPISEDIGSTTSAKLDHQDTSVIQTKNVNATGAVSQKTQNTKIQQLAKDKGSEGIAPTLSADLSKNISSKRTSQKNATDSRNQDTSETSDTGRTKSEARPNTTSKLELADTKKKVEAGEQQKNVIKGNISSTSTSTTVASLDAKDNEEPLPMDNENKVKSSTAIPKSNGFVVSSVDGGHPNVNNVKLEQGSGNNQALENPGNIVTEKKVQEQNKPMKKIEEADLMPELLENSDDYNPGDTDNGMEAMKHPSKIGDDDLEPEIPVPETQNRRYESDSSFKPINRLAGNTYREDLDFSRGTTINVSLKESEDTGFFNYFLFSVTLVGLMYLVIHNKKKLIAFVVEGKRPRTRSRRSSTSSQYRRLENNFD